MSPEDVLEEGKYYCDILDIIRIDSAGSLQEDYVQCILVHVGTAGMALQGGISAFLVNIVFTEEIIASMDQFTISNDWTLT